MKTPLFPGIAAAVGLGIGVAALGCASKSPVVPTCTLSITPAALTLESDAGSGSITVSAAQGCSWTASTADSWISISSGGSGSGAGTVVYAVTPNASTDARAGSITIGTERHTVTQRGRSAGACTYDVSPTSADFTKDGGSGTFSVSAPDGCAWTAASDAAWLSLSTATGQGNGTVSYSVARQIEIQARTAVIMVSDRSFTVRQSGDLGSCEYRVSPVEFNPCLPAATVTTTITTATSCPWTAEANVPWVRLSSGAGTGTAVLSISFSDNYDAARQGIVMIRWPTLSAGQNVRVSQAGCHYAVSRSSFGYVAAGGSGTFDVFQQSDPIECGGALQDRCVWTAQSAVPWVVVTTPMPRSGDNPVAFTVAPNDSVTPRSGIITVRDQVVTITQNGR